MPSLTTQKILMSTALRPRNEIIYNPSTWAEWTKNGAVGNSTGLEITATNGTTKSGSINTNLKVNKKYGVLYEVVSTDLDSTFTLQSYLTGSNVTLTQTIGINKLIITTQSLISTNKFQINTSGSNTTGKKIKVKDIRTFELTSLMETEWNALTGDQLNAKYPY